MFSACDSLWCCWMELLGLIGHGVYLARWPLAVYALLYVIGAAIFLLTLRIQSTDGRLVVDRSSTAYMLAHPMRYGGQRRHKDGSSICLFYARMFNMLLFVWPFLLLWFISASTVGSAVTLLFGGVYLWPDLGEDMFMDYHRVVPFPTVFVSLPLILLSLAVWKRGPLLHFLAVAGWVVLCAVPVLVVIGVGVGAKLKLGDKSAGSLAVREFAAAKKERFCKLVEFRGGRSNIWD